MLTDSLLLSLFDGKPHPLAPLLVDWLGTSRRFAAFVSANETKIRKKLRSTREPESLRDLQLELETAYLLLQERSLSVAYEPQPRLRGQLQHQPGLHGRSDKNASRAGVRYCRHAIQQARAARPAKQQPD